MIFDYKCLRCGSNTFELAVPGLNLCEEIYECLNCRRLFYGTELQSLETHESRIESNNSAKIIACNARLGSS